MAEWVAWPDNLPLDGQAARLAMILMEFHPHTAGRSEEAIETAAHLLWEQARHPGPEPRIGPPCGFRWVVEQPHESGPGAAMHTCSRERGHGLHGCDCGEAMRSGQITGGEGEELREVLGLLVGEDTTVTCLCGCHNAVQPGLVPCPACVHSSRYERG